MRFDPFGEMLRMQREVDRLFGRLGPGQTGGGESVGVSWAPRIDVRTTDEDLVVHAELPGLSRDDIDVAVTDGVLTIKGERKSESEREDEGWVIRERSSGTFERSLVLPEGIDPASVTADYVDGVLEVRVPKAAEALKPTTHHVALGAGERA